MKRECFEDCGLFFEDFESPAGAEDWDMWIRIAKKYRFKGIDKPLVLYRLHSGNNLRKHLPELNRDIFKVLEKALKDNLYAIDEKTQKRMYANSSYKMGRKYLAAIMPHRARKAFSHSLTACPLQYKTYIPLLASLLPIKVLQILKKLFYKWRTVLML